MEPETETVIDVEAEPIDNFAPDSTEEWYSAVQIQGLLRVSKAGLQQSISKLVSIYGLDIKTLRRGAARATQYSETALKAIKLLNASKFSELRNLVEKSPATSSVGSTTAIVFLDQHNQIATTAASVADSNLSQIASFKSGLLNNYRELGRVLGKQVAAEVQLGFTEEVAAGLKKLQES